MNPNNNNNCNGNNLEIFEVDQPWLAENKSKIDRLAIQQTAPTPFATQPWLTAWLEVYSPNNNLMLLAVLDGDSLHAFIPLMKSKALKIFNVIEWLAAGRSDHAPFIYRDDSLSYTISLLTGYFIEKLSNWHVVSLRAVQLEQFNALNHDYEPLRTHIIKDDISPVFLIQGTWDEFLMSKSQRHRGNIRRLVKNSSEIDSLETKCVTRFDSSLLQEVADVEKNSWKGNSGKLRSDLCF